MKLITILKDILYDIGSICDEVNLFHKESIKSKTFLDADDQRNNHGGGGVFIYLFPNIIGFVTGMALARMFHMSGLWYILLGIMGSVVIGAMHGHISGTVTFKAGIIRNAIVTAAVALLILGFINFPVVTAVSLVALLAIYFVSLLR